MSKLIELRQKKADAIKRMREILDTAEKEARDINDVEKTEFETLEKSLADFDAKIEREEKLAKLEADMGQVANPIYRPGAPAIMGRAANDEEFRSLGEFVHAIRFNQSDRRLRNIEYREMSVKEGAGGGFMVPTQFRDELLKVTPQAAIVRPRAQVIPAGDPPDAAIAIPALDQGVSKNVYGGVTVAWTAEGGTKTETTAYLKEITLTPHEVAGYIVLTDKLLRNWQAAGALIGNLLRGAIIGTEDTNFISGDGVGKPLGLLNCPACINYNRAGASAIVYADVRGMYARAKFGGNLVWITNQTTLPQLMAMKDDSSALVWQPNAREGIPGTLIGLPVVFNERSPVLGSKGDLILADFQYYLIKDGSGPFVDASPHVYFTSNKTVMKAFWNVDGQGWPSGPFALEGSTANTVSPFVVLDVP